MKRKMIGETDAEEGKHSTQDICSLFDISRATLFRWEREGRISAVWRDWRNWRLYSDLHIEEIRTIISMRSKLSR